MRIVTALLLLTLMLVNTSDKDATRVYLDGDRVATRIEPNTAVRIEVVGGDTNPPTLRYEHNNKTYIRPLYQKKVVGGVYRVSPYSDDSSTDNPLKIMTSGEWERYRSK